MTQPSLRAVLNRLLGTQTHSLAIYLTYTSPWIHNGDERAVAVIKQVVGEQKRLGERIADHIIGRIGRVDGGAFPMEFTSTHDLSLDYLLKLLIKHQGQDIRTIEACVPLLHDDPAGHSLAEEALGAAKGHLESLEEVAVEMAKPPAPKLAQP